MPFYQVDYIAPLTSAQKQALAEAITHIHSTKFTTPRLFVNVRFSDASREETFVAGKPRIFNRIIAQVRRSPARTQADFDNLITELAAAWARIVHPETTQPADALDLRAIFINGDIIAGGEAGFTIAPAGQDVEWAKANMDAFRAKAAQGDADFAELVRDLEARPEFQ